jgi:hypothetical protein
MELPPDIQIKLHIGYALSDRLVPIACALVENLKHSTKLIEELPSLPLRQCWITAKNNTAWIVPERVLSVHTRT